jgi:hypothetical protein
MACRGRGKVGDQMHGWIKLHRGSGVGGETMSREVLGEYSLYYDNTQLGIASNDLDVVIAKSITHIERNTRKFAINSRGKYNYRYHIRNSSGETVWRWSDRGTIYKYLPPERRF